MPAPCGVGWACAHCHGGWFCVPSAAVQTVTVCPHEGGAPTANTQPPEPLTITSTAFVTVTQGLSSLGSSSTMTLHPPVGGWAYAGCYKDDEARALKNQSITTAIPKGMSNELCINYCKKQGYLLAGVEAGFQCFCGNFLVDSWLTDDNNCNATCSGQDSRPCGGNWSLSVWSPDGKAPIVAGPELQLSLPMPSLGQSEISVHPGGIRQIVVPVTSVVFVYP
ncbi:WSC-domain-containing protein, partial [Thozetella sp. PMI_491]